MPPTRSVDAFETQLGLYNGHRANLNWPAAFDAAQAALDALPSDGSLGAEKHQELLLLAWLRREHAADRWLASRQRCPGADLPDPGKRAPEIVGAEVRPDQQHRFRIGAVAVVTVYWATVSVSLGILTTVLGAPASQRGALTGWGAALLACFGVSQILSLWWWRSAGSPPSLPIPSHWAQPDPGRAPLIDGDSQ